MNFVSRYPRVAEIMENEVATAVMNGDKAALCELAGIAAEALAAACHKLAEHWWIGPDGSDIRDNPLCFSNKLMLVVSEVSESMEGDRKNLADDKLPHLPMRNVELADAVIRIGDMAGAFQTGLGQCVAEKLAFNVTREDHKREARFEQAGGKAY